MPVISALPALLATVVLACGLVTSARAAEPMNAEDFIDTTSAMNQGEINAAGSALEQDDVSPAVQDFARQLQQDHQVLAETLRQLAATRQLELAGRADLRSMASATRLALLSGQTYEREFLEAQIAAHERFIAHLDKAGEELEDDELRAFARSHLSMLREHLDQAKKLHASVSEEAAPEQ